MFEAGSIVWRIQTVGKDVLKQDLDQTEAAARKAGASLDETGKKAGDVGKKSQQAAPQVRTLGDEITRLSDKGQRAATDVGRSMVIIGTAVVATSGLAVKAAIDWESSWTGVTKTVDENRRVVGGSYKEIEAGLRDLTKVLPASHREIAAVAEAAGQLGVRSQDIVKFTKTMIDLGETTNLTSDEAATSLAQLMNIMQTAPEDVGRLGAAVVALGNDGASTERDIVQMAQRIAGAANIIGLTEGEALGLANALASVGIEAEAGGSSVSRIMIDIANAVSQNGEDLKAWAKVAGISAEEFAVRFRTKPAEALTLVIEGMGRLNETGGDVFALLDKLGQTDIRTTRALLNLAGAGTLLRDSLELGNRSWEEQIALQIEADKRYATAAARIDMARNSIVDMAIELGAQLLPMVVAATEGVTDFANFIGGLPDGLQGAVAGLGLLGGAVILFGGIALLAIPKVLAFRAALATLTAEAPLAVGALKGVGTFLTGPWGIAMVAAAAGLLLLNNAADGMKATSDQLTGSLEAQNRTAEKIFETFAKGSGGLLGAAANFERIQEAINAVDDANNPFAFFLDNDLNKVFNTLRRIGEQLGELAGTDLPAAQESFRMFVEQTDGTEESQWRLLNAFQGYKEQLIAVATANGDYAETLTETEKRQVILEYAQGTGVGVTKSAAAAYVDAANQAKALTKELDDLITVLNEANGVGQDAISKNIDYRNTLAEVDEAIQNAREGVEGYGLGLDQNTQVGRDNMAMLVDLAESAWEAAAAQFELDGNTTAYRQSLEASRETLIQRAIDFGYTREEAEKLADQILAIPTETEWVMIADTVPAREAINGVIRDYQGREIQLRIGVYGQQLYTRDGRTFYEADGGKVEFFANGGRNEHHVAQFARAGDVRVWAEPETGGEWYIPAAPEKRGRSTMILREAAQEFGYELVPAGAQHFADGGSASLPTSRPTTAQDRAPLDLSDNTIDRWARATARYVRGLNRQGGDVPNG